MGGWVGGWVGGWAKGKSTAARLQQLIYPPTYLPTCKAVVAAMFTSPSVSLARAYIRVVRSKSSFPSFS